MSQNNTSQVWTGPTAKDMIASHTLAMEIMQRHGSNEPVLDDFRIEELRKFVNDPLRANEMLQAMESAKSDGLHSDDATAGKGTLTGYIMAQHGTDKAALTEDEIHILKEWFDNGGGKTTAFGTA